VSDSPFRSGAFAPVFTDLSSQACTVSSGSIPRELVGAYMRNGPNSPVEPAGPYIFPLDGDGMVHSVRFEDGQARYTRQFVRTPMLEAEIEADRPLWGTVMMGLQPLPGSGVEGTKDLPDINVLRHAGQLIALAEGTRSYGLHRHDLTTMGPVDFWGQYPLGGTAHPKVDPTTGNLLLFSYLPEAPFLNWCEIGADGSVVRPVTPIEGLDFPSMVHDCAITAEHLVIPVYPLVFDAENVLGVEGNPMRWEPERGTRIAVIERATGKVTWCEAPPRWAWHTANAFVSSPGTVYLDLVMHDAFLMPGQGGGDHATMRRLELNLANATTTEHPLAPYAGEFPRVDDRFLGQLAPESAMAGMVEELPSFNAIITVDTTSGAVDHWAGDQPVGEPVYIPHPSVEGDGWWCVLRPAPEGGVSQLLLLEAGNVSAGPVTVIDLPDRVPVGLHGAWLPGPA